MGRGSSKAGGGAGGGKVNGPMDQILNKLNGNEPWTKADKSALNSAIKNAAVGDSLIYTGSGGSETYIKGPNGWEHAGVVDSPQDTSAMSMTMVTMAGYQDSGGNSWSYKPAQSTKQPTAKATTSTTKKASTAKTAATKATPTAAKKAASSLIKDATNTKGKLSAKGKTTEFINPQTGEKMRVNIAGATKQKLVTNSKTKATSKASQKSYMVTITNLATGAKDTMNIQSLPALRSYIYGLTGIS